MSGEVWDGTGVDPWLPQRLEARAETAGVERSIREAVWSALSGWLVKLSRRVIRKQAPPDLSAIWAVAPLWNDAVGLILKGEILPAIGVAFTKVLGPDFQYAARPAVTAHLAETRNQLVRVPDEVYDLVAGEVAQGVNLGESIPKLSARIDEVLATEGSEHWSNRATTIARSETISALNAGRVDAFNVVADDADVPMEMLWLCVRGDTPVGALGATAAARRHYEGPMISLVTTMGSRVSLTPKHRVLTGRGWVAAQNLHQGDHLIHVLSHDAARTPDVQDSPTLIGDAVDAAMAALPIKVRTVRRGMDLDSNLIDSQVQVIDVNGDLARDLEAGVGQNVCDLFLTHADILAKAFLLSDRHGQDRRSGFDPPPVGCADSRTPSSLGYVALPGHPEHPGIVASPDGHPCICQDLVDHRRGTGVPESEGGKRVAAGVLQNDLGSGEIVASPCCDTEPLSGSGLFDPLRPLEHPASGLCRREQGTARPQAPSDRFGAPAQDGGDLFRSLAGLVALDDIVNVQVDWWSGHVYDLSTVSEWFTADRLIIHNSTDDTRTRPTHRVAEGQRVPVGQPFIVGGFPMMFPGDPLGPPQERINCRCVPLLVEQGESVDMSNRQMRKPR